MARAEDQPDSDSDYDSNNDSGSDDGSNSASCSDSGTDDSEEGSEEEEENDEDVEAGATKKKRVRADIAEMHRMMAYMDRIKARLQQRFAAERQARAERLACKDQERKIQNAAQRKSEEETRDRQVEVSVQTETKPINLQQQMHVLQESACPPHLSDGAAGGVAGAAALPAVCGGTEFADATPNNGKLVGLSLYDPVKTSGFVLSRQAPSLIRQVDQPEKLSTRFSNVHERMSPGMEQHLHDEQQDRAEQEWGGGNSRLDHNKDSVIDGLGPDDNDIDNDSYSASRQNAILYSAHNTRQSKNGRPLPTSHQYDENSASVINSLVSSGADNQAAVFPDLIQRRDDKFNAASLSTGKRPPPSTHHSGKTDEQQEMEAIQCLLFGPSVRR